MERKVNYTKKEINYKYNKSKKGIISKMYSHQKECSIKRGHEPPSYTKDELKDWLFSQKLFHELYDEYKASGFQKMLIPSVDRMNDYKGYSLSNIQLTTWGENNTSQYIRKRSGQNNKACIEVVQLTKDGKFISKYRSLAEAQRVTGALANAISKCCRNEPKYNTANGYKWEFYCEEKQLSK